MKMMETQQWEDQQIERQGYKTKIYKKEDG